MKSNALFLALILGIIALLAVGAFLTHDLLSTEMTETSVPASSQDPVEILKKGKQAPPVHEVVVEATDNEITPSDEARSTKNTDVETKSEKNTSTTGQAAAAQTASAQNAGRRFKLTPRIASMLDLSDGESSNRTSAGSDHEAVGIGIATDVEGRVLATSRHKGHRTLKRKSTVFLFDKIETAAKSKLTIRFMDDSVLSQGENSTVVLDEYVYDINAADKNTFGMRFSKGVCRLVTGAVAENNPDAVHVRTRMATIGIRGCDLGFSAEPTREDIYVFDLSPGRTVLVETSNDGRPLMNTLTGAHIPLEEGKETRITVSKPQRISLAQGRAPVTSPISPDNSRAFRTMTSIKARAMYKARQSPSGATITIIPEDNAKSSTATEKSEE